MAEKVTNFDDIEKCILSKLEKCTDDFKKANLMRLDVLASYTAHSETKINGASILEEHLENYIPLVCNTSKINNYADLLKTKLKNSSHTNKKRLTKWEITKIDDISDILTEMNVNNRKYEDDDKSKNISNDQFYKLQLLHHQFVDDVETNKSTKHHEDLTFSSTSNNQQNFRQNLLTNDDKKNKPQTSNDEFFRNASASMEHQYPFNHFNNTINRDQSSTIGRQEIPHRNQVQVDKSNEFFQAASASMEHHHHPPPPSLSDFHNMKNSRVGNFTTERQEIPQKNGMPDKINEFFRTASMEYHIQHIKKNVGNSMQRLQQQHDQGPSSSSSSFEYGISKRSLGLGGRRNVRSKFVPPVKRTLEEMEESSGQFTSKDRDGGGDSSEEIDSRLKNIDPKLIEMIKNEIMRTVTQTTWDDIAGLEYTKSVIKEAIVWPLLRPDIFTGLRRPPRGVLLFGPPGTGKTMIGKCIASQSKSTFFSISASSLTSKWVGEGEKMVRALFAVASVHQPSVVFIDEIDSLLCQRSENEHESSRRIKTEFLVQLDGAATSDDEKILIVGATNRPQELDEAARRRLVRRLYVPLPEYEARCKMLKNLLSSIKHELTDTDIKHIAELTDGYSGADIKTLCTEASLEPIRSIPANLIPVFDKDNVRPVIFTDFEMAITRVRSSVSQDDLKQYIEWNKIYGSGNVSK